MSAAWTSIAVTVSADLMEAADLLPGEKVDIVDIDNGARLSTYVIEGPRHSGVIGINGAAARLISPGDLVILIAYALVEESGARDFKPSVVFVDAENKVLARGQDAAEVPDGHGLVSGAVLRGAGSLG